MKRISKFLADYVIDKGVVEEKEREIYEYGFTIAMELIIFIGLCLVITVALQMYLEGILFFVIFIPLRSYAGGLHLKTYSSCLVASVLVFTGVLVLDKLIQMPAIPGCIMALCSLIGIYALYPVENVNRDVDDQEDRYFKRKLKLFLALDLILIFVFFILSADREIWIIAFTLVMVLGTMGVGKYSNLCSKKHE